MGERQAWWNGVLPDKNQTSGNAVHHHTIFAYNVHLYSFNRQVSPAKEYLFINDEGHAILIVKYVSLLLLTMVQGNTCDSKCLFRHLKNSFLSPEILEFIQSKPKVELDS